ncbi:MAG: peptide/nickel transport system substrate-binding protein [Chloroflexota bacterium]|jgi:peptide/nickel transport system substrate-binding protein|nr:peptide/nickel transport system substrate-binding protein [Chloroflexota bacterium]
MYQNRVLALIVMAVVTAAACAPAAPGATRATGGEAGSSPQQAAQPSRTLVIATKVEPTTLAPRALVTTGSSPTAPAMGMFSAWLASVDGHGVSRPQLAEKLPQLNTGDWQVFPDGQMETTYKLRSGLTWHDGAPLTAPDFVFGFQVYSNPDLGVRADEPIKYMSSVTAPDDRTVVVHWKQSWTDADALVPAKNGGLPAMPRHVLEEKYRTSDVQTFLADPYWSTGFLGSGPYRLDKWDRGASIEASAFDGFVEGRPQIARLRWIFLGDENAAVASLLSGDVHVAAGEAISLEQGAVLNRQWSGNGEGAVISAPNKSRFIQVQFKDGYSNPRAIADLRVRRAFLESANRAELSGAILDGQVAIAHAIAGTSEEYSADMDRAVTKYPFNPQEAASLMSQAGFTKGSDGFYADATGQRLSLELRSFPADPGPREAAILTNQWKDFGADVSIYIIPNAQAQDLEQVSAYPAFRIEQSGLTGTTAPVKLTSSGIATPANRWIGNNRGGWSNAEYDRLIETFATNLNRDERHNAMVQAMKIASDELPILPLYYLPLVAARTANLEGPVASNSDDLAWDNTFQWHWTR